MQQTQPGGNLECTDAHREIVVARDGNVIITIGDVYDSPCLAASCITLAAMVAAGGAENANTAIGRLFAASIAGCLHEMLRRKRAVLQ